MTKIGQEYQLKIEGLKRISELEKEPNILEIIEFLNNKQIKNSSILEIGKHSGEQLTIILSKNHNEKVNK